MENEEWISDDSGLVKVRNNYDKDTGIPAGVLGQIMPGAMAAAHDHNELEEWKARKDKSYTPQFIHPPVVPVAEPEIDREANREQLAGIVEAPAEEPREAPGEDRPMPETMPELWKEFKLMGKGKSKYDFGVNTVNKCGKTPSIDASLRAYEKVIILAVARALVARSYGFDYDPETVKESAKHSFKRLTRFAKYRDCIKEHPEAVGRLREIFSQVDRFISGKVDVQANYMLKWSGQRWSIEAFLKYMGKARLLTFKRVENSRQPNK